MHPDVDTRPLFSTVSALVTTVALALLVVSAPDARAQDPPETGSAAEPGSTAEDVSDVVVENVESPSSDVQRADDVTPEELLAAILPDPADDEFFYRIPDGFDSASPGDVLDTRDVTPTARTVTSAPLGRADQFLVRSTEPDGTPTRATATLLTPAEPWTGDGPRPLFVNAEPINSLGTECTPGYTWANGRGPQTPPISIGPPVTADALAAGYAVLIPDHEGPKMAYADPFVAGYSILDTLRGVGDVAPELADSPVAMFGYSGGAIALNGTVKLMADYAPELVDRVTGAVLGGTPADFGLLLDSMSGNLASGLLTAAILGLLRHNPEILPLANDVGVRLATSPIRNQCMGTLTAAGVTQTPIDRLMVSEARESDTLRAFLERTRMSDVPSAVPLHVFHGAEEFWVPPEGGRTLAAEQCALGVDVEYSEVPGEHILANYTGYEPAMRWIEERLAGDSPAPRACP